MEILAVGGHAGSSVSAEPVSETLVISVIPVQAPGAGLRLGYCLLPLLDVHGNELGAVLQHASWPSVWFLPWWSHPADVLFLAEGTVACLLLSFRPCLALGSGGG